LVTIFFTFLSLQWYPEIIHHCPKTPLVLVGTKLDKRDDKDTKVALKSEKKTPVTHSQGAGLARDLKCVAYHECSALTQQGLPEIFAEAVRSVLTPKVQHSHFHCQVL